jgi:predicted dehydrogenase
MGKGKSINRREFIGKTSKAALGAGIALMAAPSINVLGANEKILAGIVGAGGRGRFLMDRIMKVPGVELVAVADIYEGWLQRGVTKAQEKSSEVKGYNHHKKLLEDNRLDAVVIATPEHAHSHHVIDACNAGKDVYCEKPMVHRWHEGREIVKVAELNKRIVQVGTQRRSQDIYKQAREIVQAGKIGKVTQVRAFWFRNSSDDKPQWRYTIPEGVTEKDVNWKEFLGDAPYVPWDPHRYFQWRCYWDYSNGPAGDLMVHQIDAINMVMGTTVPEAALGTGAIYRWNDAGRTTPDTWSAVLEYREGFAINYSCMFSNEHYGHAEQFLGTDGTVELKDERELLVYAESEKVRKQAVGEIQVQTQGDQNYEHLANFFECVRTRNKPNCDEIQGFYASAAADMTVQSHFLGKKVRWDATRLEVII